MTFHFPWQDRRGALSPLKATTFALMFVPAIWLLDRVWNEDFGRTPLAGLTYWSGVEATALLILALAVTPAAKLFRWSGLIVVRRMIGVTALVYTIAHIIIYFALRFWDFVFIFNETFTRLSLIIATIATIGVIALGATSFDAAIKYMGRNWQRLHNTVYVITALALVHYLLSPGVYSEQYLLTGMFFWVMVWRWLEAKGRASDPGVLILLAVATALFTALAEAFWTWAYQDFEFLWTLGNNFSLTFGLAAAWKNLALGLLIALATAILNARRVRLSQA
jgi:sulfoxide reductase heme-binding subunit YedZ